MVVRSSCISHGGQITVYFTWWSDHRAFYQSAQYNMMVRSPCIPPVSTVPHGVQITVHSTSDHSTTWCSDHRVFHQSAQYHTVVRSPSIPPMTTVPHVMVRSPCISPVNTVPHGGQITVHSTSQYSTSWWSNHRVFHRSTQYHTVVRSSSISQVNTVQHGGQIIVHSTSQHSNTWCSDHRAFPP